MTEYINDPFEASLLHARWINGLFYVVTQDIDEDSRLAEATVNVLASVLDNAMTNSTLDSMVSTVGLVLRLGYYLGKHGVDSSAPVPSTEFLKEYVEPLITPGCDCPHCAAKIALLKEHGVEYEMTPERAEQAETLRAEVEKQKKLMGLMPPEEFNPSTN